MKLLLKRAPVATAGKIVPLGKKTRVQQLLDDGIPHEAIPAWAGGTSQGEPVLRLLRQRLRERQENSAELRTKVQSAIRDARYRRRAHI